MILKRILLTVFLIWGASVAQASSLSAWEVDPNGAMGEATGAFNPGTGAGDFIFGPAAGTFTVGPPAPHLFIATPTGQFTATIPGSLSLGGLLQDSGDVGGVFTALYLTAGGALASNFGTYFIIEFTPALAPGLTTAKVSATRAINPIPLPAGLPLLLASVGGLALLKRRKKV